MSKKKPNLFCFSRGGGDPHEVKLSISKEDKMAFDGLPRGYSTERVTVTDLNTKKKWSVRRASCGAGCYCAAQAEPVEKKGVKPWSGKFRPDRDCDRNGNTNADRASRAESGVRAYGDGNYGDLEDPCVIQDLLCDLMHLCDRRAEELGDETFEAMLESARGCYEEER